jgi:drug/metabolite transporter (DMT)-like permease
VLVIAATQFWGASATLARSRVRDRHVPPATAVELRLLIATALLGLWLAVRRPEALRVRRQDWVYLVTLGLFGVSAVQGTYYFAIALLGVGLAILLQYLAPALLVAVDVVRGRRVRGRVIAAVIAAVCGTALLVTGIDRSAPAIPPAGWVAGFGAAVSFAFYIVYSKRGLARYAPETVLFYSFLVAAVLWSFITPFPRILAAGYDRTTWWMFGALGVFSTLVPFACFYAGLRHLTPTQAGVLATMEPAIAVLSAALVLGEGLAPQQWLGAVLVMGAAVTASLETPAAFEARAAHE